MSPRATFAILSCALTFPLGHAGAQVVLSPTRYELDLEVDHAAELLRGTVRVVLQNPSREPVSRASLLLYRLLRAQSVRDDVGANLTYRQAVVAFEDFGKLQVNQIVVDLAAPLAPGAETGIQIQYEGPLVGYSETGMLYVKDRIDTAFTILRDDSWAYPQPGYPSTTVNRAAPEWKFSYAARITVPTGFTVANGGRLDGTDARGDRTTFRFSNLKPCWRMDFAIARYRSVTSGPFRVFYLPGDSAGAQGVATAAAGAMDLFSRWFGPLRGAPELTFIEIPDGWGSQADVTTVIQSAAAFRDPRQHREVYHEISHLWNVTPTDRPSPRWDEGLASFLEYVVTQETTGKPEVDERATQLVDWLRGALSGHPEWRRSPLVDYGRTGLTDLSYSVGALYFDLLYRLAGREDFNRIIGGFAAEFGASGGSTRDLAEVAQKLSTLDVSSLSNDWLFTAGWADRIEQGGSIRDIEAYYRSRARGGSR